MRLFARLRGEVEERRRQTEDEVERSRRERVAVLRRLHAIEVTLPQRYRARYRKRSS